MLEKQRLLGSVFLWKVNLKFPPVGIQGGEYDNESVSIGNEPRLIDDLPA